MWAHTCCCCSCCTSASSRAHRPTDPARHSTPSTTGPSRAIQPVRSASAFQHTSMSTTLRLRRWPARACAAARRNRGDMRLRRRPARAHLRRVLRWHAQRHAVGGARGRGHGLWRFEGMLGQRVGAYIHQATTCLLRERLGTFLTMSTAMCAHVNVDRTQRNDTSATERWRYAWATRNARLCPTAWLGRLDASTRPLTASTSDSRQHEVR
jgi:hypothetical protein